MEDDSNGTVKKIIAPATEQARCTSVLEVHRWMENTAISRLNGL